MHYLNNINQKSSENHPNKAFLNFLKEHNVSCLNRSVQLNTGLNVSKERNLAENQIDMKDQIKDTSSKPIKQTRSFKINDRVLARCSEGEAFRGYIKEIREKDLCNIEFDDGDNCDVRNHNIRHLISDNMSGTLEFRVLKNAKERLTKNQNCMGCDIAIEPSILPQYLYRDTPNSSKFNRKRPNSGNFILTCFYCGDSWHKSCYRSAVFFQNSSFKQDRHILQGFKCRFCLIHIFSEVFYKCKKNYTASINLNRKNDMELNDYIVYEEKFKQFYESKFNEIPEYLYEEYSFVTSKLNYNPSSLKWNTTHMDNAEEVYCYRGSTGDWWFKMIQCIKCQQWFHEKCLINVRPEVKCGDLFYLLYCSSCGIDNKEFLVRLPMTLLEAVQLIIYNIQISGNNQMEDNQNGGSNSFFDYDNNIWSYCEKTLPVLPVNFGKQKPANLKSYILEKIIKANPAIFQSRNEISCISYKNGNTSYGNRKNSENRWRLLVGKPPKPEHSVIKQTQKYIINTHYLKSSNTKQSGQNYLNGNTKSLTPLETIKNGTTKTISQNPLNQNIIYQKYTNSPNSWNTKNLKNRTFHANTPKNVKKHKNSNFYNSSSNDLNQNGIIDLTDSPVQKLRRSIPKSASESILKSQELVDQTDQSKILNFQNNSRNSNNLNAHCLQNRNLIEGQKSNLISQHSEQYNRACSSSLKPQKNNLPIKTPDNTIASSNFKNVINSNFSKFNESNSLSISKNNKKLLTFKSNSSPPTLERSLSFEPGGCRLGRSIENISNITVNGDTPNISADDMVCSSSCETIHLRSESSECLSAKIPLHAQTQIIVGPNGSYIDPLTNNINPVTGRRKRRTKTEMAELREAKKGSLPSSLTFQNNSILSSSNLNDDFSESSNSTSEQTQQSIKLKKSVPERALVNGTSQRRRTTSFNDEYQKRKQHKSDFSKVLTKQAKRRQTLGGKQEQKGRKNASPSPLKRISLRISKIQKEEEIKKIELEKEEEIKKNLENQKNAEKAKFTSNSYKKPEIDIENSTELKELSNYSKNSQNIEKKRVNVIKIQQSLKQNFKYSMPNKIPRIVKRCEKFNLVKSTKFNNPFLKLKSDIEMDFKQILNNNQNTYSTNQTTIVNKILRAKSNFESINLKRKCSQRKSPKRAFPESVIDLNAMDQEGEEMSVVRIWSED